MKGTKLKITVRYWIIASKNWICNLPNRHRQPVPTWNLFTVKTNGHLHFSQKNMRIECGMCWMHLGPWSRRWEKSQSSLFCLANANFRAILLEIIHGSGRLHIAARLRYQRCSSTSNKSFVVNPCTLIQRINNVIMLIPFECSSEHSFSTMNCEKEKVKKEKKWFKLPDYFQQNVSTLFILTGIHCISLSLVNGVYIFRTTSWNIVLLLQKNTGFFVTITSAFESAVT